MTIYKLDLKHVLLHLIAILVFIFYENSIIFIIEPKSRLIYILPFYIPALAMFYVNTFFVMQLWLKPRLKLLVIVFCICEIIFYGIANSVIFVVIQGVTIGLPEVLKLNIIFAKGIWRAVYFLGLSITYWAIVQNIKNAKRANLLELQKVEGEKKRIELENAFLRTQINPTSFTT